MFALRNFSYRDLETGGIVHIKQGDPVAEKVLKMHRDPEVLIRTKYVAADDPSRAMAVIAPVKRKRGRPKKNP